MSNDNLTFKEGRGFTIHQDQNIDSQLMEQMKIICDEIKRKYDQVYSILLAGGFGRGEGSIKITKDGKVMPLKDYDIYVITDVEISEKEYIDMIRRIHDRISIESSWYFSVAPGAFNIGVQAIRLDKLKRLPPDIATIDLKFASKVLYGEDLRKEILLSLDDIILSTGALVLFNKTIGLLENMNLRFFIEEPSKEERNSMIYECGKTFVEMCTALTILARKYSPSYAKRAEYLPRLLNENFPSLLKKLPDLSSRVAFFTDLKLTSRFDEYVGDPVQLWFVTRQYFDEILKYYLDKFLNLDSSDGGWIDFSKSLYRELSSEFFKEYLHYNLRDFAGYNRRLLPVLSLVGQLYDNFHFVNRIRSIEKVFYLTPILSWRSPLIKIFCASTLALNSINIDGSIDAALLNEAVEYIKKAYPLIENHSSDRANWDAVRQACVKSQKLYFTRTNVIAI